MNHYPKASFKNDKFAIQQATEKTMRRTKTGIVNNAEPSISEFAQPLQKMVAAAGMEAILVEYADSPGFPFNQTDGVLLTGSPQGNDIVAHHLPWFHWLEIIKKPVFSGFL